MKILKLDADIGYQTRSTAWGREIGPDVVDSFLAAAVPGERVKIEINSAGGYVIPGMAIANSIKNSPAHVVAHVTGLAASMASVIMCACDEIQVEEGAFVMIHNPWGWAEGDAEELRKEAEVLDTMKAGIMAFYRGKFPDKTAEEISAMMDAETWMTGDAALEAGLKCVVIPATVRAAASATRHKFASIPEAARKFLDVRDEPPAPPPAQSAADGFSSLSPEGGASSAADGLAPSPEGGASSDPAPESAAAEAPAPESAPESAAAEAPAPDAAWEARLAGLQAAKDREIAALAAERNSLKSQLDESQKALASAQAEASSFRAKVEEAEHALAQAREQLEAEIAQHRKLASAALQQPAKGAPAGTLAAWTAAMHERTLERRGKK